MTPFEKIKLLLDENHCEYESFTHDPVRTSEEAAAVRPGITLKQGAKALICRAMKSVGDDETIMIIVCGNQKIDWKKVKKSLQLKDITMISPEEVLTLTGVEIGGIPPFGNVFGIKTYADQDVFTNDKIAFNAGSRSITIIMKSTDYDKLVSPERGDFAKQ